MSKEQKETDKEKTELERVRIYWRDMEKNKVKEEVISVGMEDGPHKVEKIEKA